MTSRAIGMRTVKQTLARRTETASSPRRRQNGRTFWMDWAPMILLGLMIALSSIQLIGSSLQAGASGSAVATTTVQPVGRADAAVAAQAQTAERVVGQPDS